MSHDGPTPESRAHGWLVGDAPVITRAEAHRRDAEELLAQARRIRLMAERGQLTYREADLSRADRYLAEAQVHATLAGLPEPEEDDA